LLFCADHQCHDKVVWGHTTMDYPKTQDPSQTVASNRGVSRGY